MSDYVGNWVGGEAAEAAKSFVNPHGTHEFFWGMADIIGAILGAGLRLEVFEEYNYSRDCYFFDEMTVDEEGRVKLSGDVPSFPIMYGIRGVNYGVVSACSSGAHSIGLAARTIERGEQDLIVAGGAEFATCPTGIGGFASAKALSTRNDDPTAASRPWDAERDGFVLSDGAGILVLESFEHAEARGAEIYAELVGFAMNSDAYHITAPSPGAVSSPPMNM